MELAQAAALMRALLAAAAALALGLGAYLALPAPESHAQSKPASRYGQDALQNPGSREPTLEELQRSGDLYAYPTLLIAPQQKVPVALGPPASISLVLRNPTDQQTAVRARLSGESGKADFYPARVVVAGRGQATMMLTIETLGLHVGDVRRLQVEFLSEGQVIAVTELQLQAVINYPDCLRQDRSSPNAAEIGAPDPMACAQRALARGGRWQVAEEYPLGWAGGTAGPLLLFAVSLLLVGAAWYWLRRLRWRALLAAALALVLGLGAYLVLQKPERPVQPKPARRSGQDKLQRPGHREVTIQELKRRGFFYAYPTLLIAPQRDVPLAARAPWPAMISLTLRNPTAQKTAVRARLRRRSQDATFSPARVVVPGRGQASIDLSLETSDLQVGDRRRVQVEFVTDRGQVIAATELRLQAVIHYEDCVKGSGHSPEAGAVEPMSCARRAVGR